MSFYPTEDVFDGFMTPLSPPNMPPMSSSSGIQPWMLALIIVSTILVTGVIVWAIMSYSSGTTAATPAASQQPASSSTPEVIYESDPNDDGDFSVE